MSVIDTEPVLDVAELRGGVAILKQGRLEFTDQRGALVAEERVDETSTVLIAQGSELRILSRERIDTIETDGRRPMRRLESALSLDLVSHMRSSIDGRLYGEERRLGRYLAIVMKGNEVAATTDYPEPPWQARAVRSGRFVLHLGGGMMLGVYRSAGPRAIAPVVRLG